MTNSSMDNTNQPSDTPSGQLVHGINEAMRLGDPTTGGDYRAGVDELVAAGKRWMLFGYDHFEGETLRRAVAISEAIRDFAAWVKDPS